MGLEKIRQSVLAEAKKEATRIVESARRNAENLLKSQKEAADQEFDRLWKIKMQAIEEEAGRKLIQCKGAAGKKILDKRNTLLTSLFETAKKEILAWPPDKYSQVMRRLIEKASGNDRGMIRVHSDEREVFAKILSRVNEGRRDSEVTLDRSASLPDRGGFVFVSSSFEVDQTLDTILREVEHGLLPVIAAELFPEK